MRNGTSKGRRANLNRAAHPCIKLGYQDAWAGRGFHPHYDRWTHFEQKHYEAGRLYVVTLRGEGRSSPPWPDRRKTYPDGVVYAQREIRALPGNWIVTPPSVRQHVTPPTEAPCQVY